MEIILSWFPEPDVEMIINKKLHLLVLRQIMHPCFIFCCFYVRMRQYLFSVPQTLQMASTLHFSHFRNFFFSFLGHFFFLQIWPNNMGKKCLHPSVRPYVDTFTMKRNAATNRLMIFVELDLPFTMIWLLLSFSIYDTSNLTQTTFWKQV